MPQEGLLVHFAKFLSDLDQATNESQKRHLFTSLAAVGFGGTDFATELALSAEYKIQFQEKGLVRRGAVVEVSWVEMPEVDKRERRGRECDLISAYRRLTGQNPTCQFAGMPEAEIE